MKKVNSIYNSPFFRQHSKWLIIFIVNFTSLYSLYVLYISAINLIFISSSYTSVNIPLLFLAISNMQYEYALNHFAIIIITYLYIYITYGNYYYYLMSTVIFYCIISPTANVICFISTGAYIHKALVSMINNFHYIAIKTIIILFFLAFIISQFHSEIF